MRKKRMKTRMKMTKSMTMKTSESQLVINRPLCIEALVTFSLKADSDWQV